MKTECCFCGNEIVPHAPDPIRLTVSAEPGEEQELFCHHRCLQRAVHPTVPLLVAEDNPQV